MTRDRKKPGVAFWATVVVVVVLYPISAGSWMYANGRWPGSSAVHVTRWVMLPIHVSRWIAPDMTAATADKLCHRCWIAGRNHGPEG
jgi:hypothetical protein